MGMIRCWKSSKGVILVGLHIDVHNAKEDLNKNLIVCEKLIERYRDTVIIVAGDFNVNFCSSKGHKFQSKMEDLGFTCYRVHNNTRIGLG